MGAATAWMCWQIQRTMPLIYSSWEAKNERAVGLRKPTLATVFEVVVSGRVYRVAGTALQRWIIERRQQWNGPKGYMFSKRPGLE